MDSDDLGGILAGAAIVLSILYIYRANILAVIFYFIVGLFLSICMGAFILWIEGWVGAYMSKTALTSASAFLGYTFLRGFIAGWSGEVPVGGDAHGSQKLEPIDGEILPPLRDRHVFRRVEKDVF